jgi:hypothetical protein
MTSAVNPQRWWALIVLAFAQFITIMDNSIIGVVAKQRVARQLGSQATHGEGTQNLLCAYLAAAVLLGLAGNVLFGWCGSTQSPRL